jgi:hypothetical protein
MFVVHSGSDYPTFSLPFVPPPTQCTTRHASRRITLATLHLGALSARRRCPRRGLVNRHVGLLVAVELRTPSHQHCSPCSISCCAKGGRRRISGAAEAALAQWACVPAGGWMMDDGLYCRMDGTGTHFVVLHSTVLSDAASGEGGVWCMTRTHVVP